VFVALSHTYIYGNGSQHIIMEVFRCRKSKCNPGQPVKRMYVILVSLFTSYKILHSFNSYNSSSVVITRV